MPASAHSQDEPMPDVAPQSQEQEQVEDEDDMIELDGLRISIVSNGLLSPLVCYLVRFGYS